MSKVTKKVLKLIYEGKELRKVKVTKKNTENLFCGERYITYTNDNYKEVEVCVLFEELD